MSAVSRSRAEAHVSRRMVQTCSVIAWIILITAVSLMESARPERETFLDRHHDKVIRVSWNVERANAGMTLLIVNLFVCMLGVGVEISRRVRFDVPLSRFMLSATVLTLFAFVIYQQSV